MFPLFCSNEQKTHINVYRVNLISFLCLKLFRKTKSFAAQKWQGILLNMGNFETNLYGNSVGIVACVREYAVRSSLSYFTKLFFDRMFLICFNCH